MQNLSNKVKKKREILSNIVEKTKTHGNKWKYNARKHNFVFHKKRYRKDFI